MMDFFKQKKASLLDDEEEDENPFKDLCTLSYKTRLIGFGACLVVGLILWIVSLFSIGAIVLHPERFAVMYTIGNIVSLAGTSFLIGPMRQLKRNVFSDFASCVVALASRSRRARSFSSRARVCVCARALSCCSNGARFAFQKCSRRLGGWPH